jgi:2-keto-3-deoxy-L-rhamnonate aldolase RhmA
MLVRGTKSSDYEHTTLTEMSQSIGEGRMIPERIPTRYHRALAEGRPAVGIPCGLDGYATSHLLGALGMDFILIEGQHSAFDWQNIETMCWRVRSTGAAVFVRLGSDDASDMNLALGLPVDGVIIPDIESLDQAQRVLRAASPSGGRNAMMLKVYDRATDTPLLGFMIEHIDAVNEIDEILALPGLGLIAIGHADLARSMGIDRSNAQDPALVDAIRRVRTASRDHRIPCWVHAPTVAAALAEVQAGADVIMWSFDTSLLADAVKVLFDTLNLDKA